MTKGELEEIEQKALKKMRDVVKSCGGDTEYIHITYDEILVDILKKIGMNKVADKFEKQYKWYS